MLYRSSSIALLVVVCICVLVTAFHIPISSKPILNLGPSIPVIDFHTPVFTEGTALQHRITTDTTVGPEQGTIIINSLITVAPGAVLTILPGTTLAVSEFGGISVFGSLHAIGTPDKEITFITNEQNEVNKHWVGILLQNGSNSDIQYVSIHHASPAISCAPHIHTTISHVSFLLDAVGFAHTLFTCQDIQSGAK
ncbi:MAG TPA: hypothetical protein VLG69_02230 [Candidatus Andersenbacteria bacterium]|nr:hypothetical protein [Candidatus Andersenbacteria bacterium]